MERDILRVPTTTKSVVRAQEAAAPARSVEQWGEKVWWVTALPLILLITVPIVTLFTRTSLPELVGNIGLKMALQAIGMRGRARLTVFSAKECFKRGLCRVAGENAWSRLTSWMTTR